MIARGGLHKCIMKAFQAYANHKYIWLSILHSKTGQYYTVVNEIELAKFTDSPIDGKHRLVFRGTEHELKVFSKSPQSDLFKENPFNGQTTTDQS